MTVNNSLTYADQQAASTATSESALFFDEGADAVPGFDQPFRRASRRVLGG